MPHKPEKAAALHFALEALGMKQDVPVGNHDLSRVQVTIRFPDFAAVARAAGDMGDGFNEVEPESLEITKDAALRFIENLGIIANGPGFKQAWEVAIRESLKAPGNVPKEAADALLEVRETAPPGQPSKQRTPAKRIGADEAIVTIKRLPKTKPRKR